MHTAIERAQDRLAKLRRVGVADLGEVLQRAVGIATTESAPDHAGRVGLDAVGAVDPTIDHIVLPEARGKRNTS